MCNCGPLRLGTPVYNAGSPDRGDASHRPGLQKQTLHSSTHPQIHLPMPHRSARGLTVSLGLQRFKFTSDTRAMHTCEVVLCARNARNAATKLSQLPSGGSLTFATTMPSLMYPHATAVNTLTFHNPRFACRLPTKVTTETSAPSFLPATHQ